MALNGIAQNIAWARIILHESKMSAIWPYSEVNIFWYLKINMTLAIGSYCTHLRLQSRFEIRYIGPCVRQISLDSWFEMRNSKTPLFWDVHLKITNLDVIWRTVQNTGFRIVIQDAHLQSRFKIRTCRRVKTALDSCKMILAQAIFCGISWN